MCSATEDQVQKMGSGRMGTFSSIMRGKVDGGKMAQAHTHIHTQEREGGGRERLLVHPGKERGKGVGWAFYQPTLSPQLCWWNWQLSVVLSDTVLGKSSMWTNAICLCYSYDWPVWSILPTRNEFLLRGTASPSFIFLSFYLSFIKTFHAQLSQSLEFWAPHQCSPRSELVTYANQLKQ